MSLSKIIIFINNGRPDTNLSQGRCVAVGAKLFAPAVFVYRGLDLPVHDQDVIFRKISCNLYGVARNAPIDTGRNDK